MMFEYLLVSLSLAASATPNLDGFAGLALDCVSREYPNKIAHVLNGAEDVRAPRALTPAFFGCFDWHSSVHGHWLLARLLRLEPRAPWGASARAALEANLTEAKIAEEVRYLAGPGRASFERPYGLAWLLALSGELREWARDPTAPLAADAQRWSVALRPLERAALERLSSWLPKLTYPVRSGEHSQTAFALGLALDWARSAQADADVSARARAFEELARTRARAWFARDVACPLAYEPSGEDFLSPCLAEADLMRRVLPGSEFGVWLKRFLPAGSLSQLAPAAVSDRSDPKLVHLDGLNLSRAWMLEGIGSALPPAHGHQKLVREAVSTHRAAGLAGVSSEHYEGGHWLGSFAAYLVTGRGLAKQQ